MMTERSGYSPTKGLHKARDDVLNHSRISTGSSQMRTGRESQLKKGMGGPSSKSPSRHPNKPPLSKNSPPKPVMGTMPNQQQSPHHDDRNSDQPPEQKSPEQYERDDPKDLVDQQLIDIDDRIDEPDPKLYVDVNVGKNKMERIVVYEGDTAESLANKFCETHKLDKNMYDKLITLLDQQIAGVLPKIVEDEDMDDSEGQA